MSSADTPLVALDPPDNLVFELVRDVSPRLVLRISNISKTKVAIKVKTTQPSWYYVRPNQHVVDVGTSEDVTISLNTAECNRFIEMTADEREGLLSKHRFLVQSKSISNETYEKVLELPINERTEEYQKIWETSSKDDKKNHKLRVEYRLGGSSSSGRPSGPATPSVSENVESVRTRLAQVDTSAPSRSVDEMPGSPEAIFAELQSLRKKYDAVVEYTVHLTAERDYHFTQLEDLRREYSREKARKKAGGDAAPNKKDAKSSEKVVQQGFSFIVVILVAVISFLVARYMHSA